MGYVSQVSLDGEVLNERFIDGLDAPGGNYIIDGTLWQMAGDLLEVDIATATVVNTFAAPEGAGLLPDVAVTSDGRAFVTGSDGTIYLAADGALTPWLQGPDLQGANGIKIDGNTIFVNAGGAIKVIDIETQAISDYGSATLGMRDDLEIVPTGMIASGGGTVVEVTPDGTVTEVIGAPGITGLTYVPDRGVVVATHLMAGELAAYQVDF